MATNEEILLRLKQVPPLVKEVFGSEDTATAVLKIGRSYNLHIDLIGYIGRDVGLLLLGIIDPMTFLNNLVNQGITESIAKDIITDVNRDIFLPLQKKIQSGTSPKEELYDEDLFDSEISKVEGAISYRSDPPQPVLAPISVEARSEVPVEKITITPSYNLIRPETPLAPGPALSVLPQPTIRTMQHDAEILQHQEVQRVPTNTAMHLDAPHPSQTTPSRSFQTASVPYNTPQAVYPKYQEPVPPPPVHANPTVTEKPSVNTAAVSSDPYREPMQ